VCQQGRKTGCGHSATIAGTQVLSSLLYTGVCIFELCKVSLSLWKTVFTTEKEKAETIQRVCCLTIFKKIGIAVMVLSLVVPALLVKGMGIGISPGQKETFKLLIMDFFILGLFFFAWAKDKTEDEMTIALRLKSMGFAFIWAVLYAVGKPLTDLLLKEPIVDLRAQELVFSMLFFYLFLYFLQKKGR
jgi:hypothetical protein